MKRSKFSENQVIPILKGSRSWAQSGGGVPHTWHQPQHLLPVESQVYGGMTVSDLRRLRELEEENRWLKQMDAELSLEHQILQDVLAQKS